MIIWLKMNSIIYLLTVLLIDTPKDLTSPVIDSTYEPKSQGQTTNGNNQGTSADNSLLSFTRTAPLDYESSVHPVFLLLIILVTIFLIVVVASILVIIKIWFYRRKKSKPQKRWIMQQTLTSKTQMSHLLTADTCDSTSCNDSSKSSITSGFDVPWYYSCSGSAGRLSHWLSCRNDIIQRAPAMHRNHRPIYMKAVGGNSYHFWHNNPSTYWTSWLNHNS